MKFFMIVAAHPGLDSTRYYDLGAFTGEESSDELRRDVENLIGLAAIPAVEAWIKRIIEHERDGAILRLDPDAVLIALGACPHVSQLMIDYKEVPLSMFDLNSKGHA